MEFAVATRAPDGVAVTPWEGVVDVAAKEAVFPCLDVAGKGTAMFKGYEPIFGELSVRLWTRK